MYKRTVLDNGLRVISSPMPHTHSVCICIFIGAGSRYENEKQAGISHFLEHLCFKGTVRRPTSRDISESIDGIGGVLNGGTDKELTVYWAKVARPHFTLALDLLADMIRNSKFDPLEIENERNVIIEELNMCVDSPQSRVDILIDEVVWPEQPLGRDVMGSKETVATIDRQLILDYLSRNYLSNDTVVSVAGDIDHNEVLDQVSKVLGDWVGGESGPWSPAQDNQDTPRLGLERRKTEQTHLCLAVRGLPHNHPDRFALDLLNVILGEGMSSRLFLEIREQRGLTYDIHSHVNCFRDSGSVAIYASVDPRKLEPTMEAILFELVKLRDEPVPEAEIVKAKELGKGRLMLRMEDTRNVASWIGGQDLLSDRIRSVDAVITLVDAITAEDLSRVAQQLFQYSKLNLALVGPVRNKGRLEKLLKL